MNERRIHRLFEISVLLKGVHAAIECIGGVALAFIQPGAILDLVASLTQDELAADPRDFVATHLGGFTCGVAALLLERVQGRHWVVP